MIWVRVSLLECSDELRSTLLRLPPKRRLRRLLLLIYAARQTGGWPEGHKEARETPDVEDTTIRVRLDEDCEELVAHLEKVPRGLRSGRLLALAEFGLQRMRDDAACEPVCQPPKPIARRAAQSKGSAVALRQSAGGDLPEGAGKRVQRNAARVDGFTDANDDALDFALNGLLGLE